MQYQFWSGLELRSQARRLAVGTRLVGGRVGARVRVRARVRARARARGSELGS